MKETKNLRFDALQLYLRLTGKNERPPKIVGCAKTTKTLKAAQLEADLMQVNSITLGPKSETEEKRSYYRYNIEGTFPDKTNQAQ